MFVKLGRDYILDTRRFDKYNFNQIQKYRDKIFQGIVKYAYTVPFYKKIYKATGIYPGDIKGIKDIEKLPIVSRQDLIDNFPDWTINPKLKKKSILMNTSGSTRNPVSLYTDQYTLNKALMAHIRALRCYGIKWYKSRISVIANFYERTLPTRTVDSVKIPILRNIFSLQNIQQINADDNLFDIMQRIDAFKPDFIIGFPGPLRHLALLRDKGYGLNIKPKCVIFSGGLLDTYAKKHISETFNTRVFNIYGSTEAGPISFECKKGNLHINSDFVYLETIDIDGNTLPKGKSGKLALTRLHGRGTPLIRYTGMGDVITLKDGICNCGIQTDLIKKIHGRIKESIVISDKKVIFPDALSDVPGEVIYRLKSNKISRIQLVQESLNKIEVLVIIDKENRDKGCSVEKFFEELKASYQKLFGSDVEVEVKEVAKLRSEDSNEESAPGILSKIDVEKYI